MANYQYYQANSRYMSNIQVADIIGGMKVPLLFEKMQFTPQDIDFYFKVTESYEGRIDLIANKVYGDSTLYWAIAIANNLESLIGVIDENVYATPVSPGDTLTITTGVYKSVPAAGDLLAIPRISVVRRYV